MENIIFTYDPHHSRKNGQFTVVLTPAVFNRGRWEIPKGTKIYFVKDLETVAARVPDKALFKTALESEMAFRKNEARFFNPDQEFTRLRIDSRHLFRFITACQKQRVLIHPDGSPTTFRMEREVIPEIGVQDDRLALYLGSLGMTGAEIIVQAMPVTLIQGNQIVQLRAEIPFALLKEIPTEKPLAETERNRLLTRLSKQPDKVRIRNTGKEEIRTVKDATAQAVVSLDEQAAKARLYFVYEGNTVKDNDDLSVVVDMRRHLEIHRNRPAEEGFKATLLSQGFSPRPDRDFNWRAPDRPLESLVPALENHGFAVRVGSRKITEPVSVRWNVQTQQQHIRVGATVFSGDFQIGVDGLFQAFQEGRRYVERPDGSLGIISGEIRRVLGELSGNGTVDQGFVTFDKADFTRVAACLGGEPDVRADPAFEALCQFGGRMDGVRRYPIPAGLETVLRPYQVLGFNWLRTLKELGLNGILADDMGLGKSVQVLALIKSLKAEGALSRPVLLIAPKTLIFNWELEIRKFAPDLSVYAFAGPARNRTPAFLEKHHLILTSYGMLRSETPLLCAMKWEYVILDEAQAIKNADTLTSRAVKHIPAAARLSITGTPVENSAADLWSQFDFLMPGFLDDLASFKERYGDTAKDLARLREKTQPYILRRLKSQVLAELPPKTEVTIYCDFADDQKAIYDQALAAARDEMDTLEGSRSFHILRLILRLRQIACHPRLAIKESRRSFGSGKTEEVFHAAVEILSEGHKILVFSQFTRHLQLIQALFLRHKIPTFYLDGRTADRAAMVHAFKAHQGPCPFFISLKAGGTGLNLSEASYVFLLDPWWNPAVENQAIDRCHRLGQHQPVTVYRFITRGSIEEKVIDLKAIKKEIESAVIDASVPQYIPFDEKTLKRLITDY
jgi:superfamily II DNA or RNA helicase